MHSSANSLSLEEIVPISTNTCWIPWPIQNIFLFVVTHTTLDVIRAKLNTYCYIVYGIKCRFVFGITQC